METAQLKIDVRKMYLECQHFWFNNRKTWESNNFVELEYEKL